MSVLPGAIRKLGPNHRHRCETEGHEHVPATHVRVGEVDSFGAEYAYFCQACIAKQSRHWYDGDCPICGEQDVKLYGYRYPDEPSGPVHEACRDCKSRLMRQFEKEFEEQD